MSALSFLKSIYSGYFAKPKHERVLFRSVMRRPCIRIVELGVGPADRAQRLLRLAVRHHGRTHQVHYAGIDLFEARADSEPGITVKLAHRKLKPLGAKIQLIPGDPYSGLARSANGLVGTDLLVIQADQDDESLERAWFYVPRMLHEDSLVFVEQMDQESQEAKFELLGQDQIDTWAQQQTRLRRAA